MAVVNNVPVFEPSPEQASAIESLFHSDGLHQQFRRFLDQHWQSVPGLRIVQTGINHRMDLDVRTRRGILRQVSVKFIEDTNGREIQSATAIQLDDDVSVLQVVLMFTSSQNYPYYTLELQSNAHLLLCCRKKLQTGLNNQDFHDLITGLAHTADLLEETMMPLPR